MAEHTDPLALLPATHGEPQCLVLYTDPPSPPALPLEGILVADGESFMVELTEEIDLDHGTHTITIRSARKDHDPEGARLPARTDQDPAADEPARW